VHDDSPDQPAAPVVSPGAPGQVVEQKTDNGAVYQVVGPDSTGDTPASVTVQDDASAPLFTVYQQLGGPAALGYPVSDRFTLAGSNEVSQVFGTSIVSYDASTGAVTTVELLDVLATLGTVPSADDWALDAGRSPDEVRTAHLAMLDGYPALQAFAGDRATLALYGLPLGIKVDATGQVTVRSERGVFHLAADGTLSAMDTVTAARAAGLIPSLTAVLQGQL
jgi:hypothetical protein